ncbi:MAG: hypothetical protein U9P80_05070 [Thermodesulfobacteriota bacterium]|nr:hypothetical protein [Thermodesulfobacteriota bacterium]
MKRSNVWFLFMGLVAFIFSSGFLGFCVGPDYDPCTIEIESPANGTVMAPGTQQVTIEGKVITGETEAVVLKAQNKSIDFDNVTGAFSYTFILDQSSIYSTCTFEVIDQKLITNKVRVSYAVGDSSEPGAAGVVDDAAALKLNESFMDMVEVKGAAFINQWKNDLVYGWDAGDEGDWVYDKVSQTPGSPFSSMAPLLPQSFAAATWGTMYINHWSYEGDPDQRGYVNLGNITMAIDIQPDNSIGVDVTISAQDWVNPRGGSNRALFVQGYHDDGASNPHFTLMANSVYIDDAALELTENADGMIVASLDMTGADVNLDGVDTEYGIFSFPAWLTEWIIDLVVDDLVGSLAMDIPIINVNELAGNIEGVTISGWPMDASIFTSTENDMNIALGLSAVCNDPVYPGLDAFYSTPDDGLPEISFEDSENTIISVKDDTINNIAFAFVQTGLLKDMDVTESVLEELGQLAVLLGIDDMQAIASLETPPICNFSGDPLDKLSYDVTVEAGRFIIPNLIIDLYDASLLPPYPHKARMSVDVNAAVQLVLSADRTHLQARLDTDNSTSQMMMLYSNLSNASLLPVISDKITNAVVDNTLKKMIDIEIPAIDLFGTSIGISLNSSALVDNCLVAKVQID